MYIHTYLYRVLAWNHRLISGRRKQFVKFCFLFFFFKMESAVKFYSATITSGWVFQCSEIHDSPTT